MPLQQLENALLKLTVPHRDKFSIAIHTDEGCIQINADVPRKTASIAKLFILAEAFRQVESGSLSLSNLVYITSNQLVGGSGVINYMTNSNVHSYRNLLELMIIVSDNTASNILLDTIGIEPTNSFAKMIGCNHTFLERKFMDSKAQANGLENVTSANDVIRFLKLFSKQNSYFTEASRKEIMKILSNQQFNDKLAAYQREDQQVKIYHKTGELSGAEHDAAIIEANGKIVEVVILTDGWENNGTAKPYIAEIGKLVIDYLLN